MHIRTSSVIGVTLLSAGAVTAGVGTANAAVKHGISVQAIDRGGRSIAVDAHLVNVQTSDGYDVGPGRTVQVPAGTYSVASTIWSEDGTETLGVRVISLSRDTKVVFDARQGHKVRFSIDDPTAETRLLQLVPLVGPTWALNPIADQVPVDQTYLIPTTSKYLTLFAYAELEKQGSSPQQPSPYRYDLTRTVKGSLPANPSFAFAKSKLARVGVTIRSSGAGEAGRLGLTAATQSGGSLPATATTEFGALPARITSYRSPGMWHTLIQSSGPYGSGGKRIYAGSPYKAASSSETYRAAAWEPAIGTGLDGRYLWLWPRTVLSSPGLGGGLSAATKQVRLYRGAKLIAQSTGDKKVLLSTTPYWYTLKLNAARKPGPGLSSKVSAVWNFKTHGYADGLSHGSPRLIWAGLAPWGLDGNNSAARGSATTVALSVSGPGAKSPVKALSLEASFNGGTTWRKVQLKQSGARWLAKVTNPGGPGFVSLRAKVKDTKGNGVTETVVNAYAIR
ncbi:hypothetical protein ACRYCC_00195 [Actinomadura scrupuli]|uniref:hypothetical protein n=1 Tax=Actinomadura scrupuli TaxID=559629 RepID=UPI003D95A222